MISCDSRGKSHDLVVQQGIEENHMNKGRISHDTNRELGALVFLLGCLNEELHPESEQSLFRFFRDVILNIPEGVDELNVARSRLHVPGEIKSKRVESGQGWNQDRDGIRTGWNQDRCGIRTGWNWNRSGIRAGVESGQGWNQDRCEIRTRMESGQGGIRTDVKSGQGWNQDRVESGRGTMRDRR